MTETDAIKSLRSKVKRKRAEVGQLLRCRDSARREAESLDSQSEVAQAALSALEEALALFGEVTVKHSPRDASSLRPGSLAARTYKVLVEQNKPTPIMELLGLLGEDQNAEKRAAVAGTISAYVRKNQIFSRLAPNTFGLIEWSLTDDDHAEGGNLLREINNGYVDLYVSDAGPVAEEEPFDPLATAHRIATEAAKG